MQNTALIEKIRNLPPETVGEVENFVDFLTYKKIKQNGEESARKSGNVNLQRLGISRTEAAAQRAALSTFSEDWEQPEMDVYDEL